MLDENPHKPNIILGLLLGAWILIGSLWAVIAPLTGGEAYVWFAAKDISWGTMDGSVLSQFFAWIGTAIGGDTHLGVRLFFLIAQPAAIYLFYDLVRDRDDRLGRDIPFYLLLFLAMPIVQLNSAQAVEWAALMLSVSAILWAYNQFIHSDGAWFDITKLGIGLALLSWSDYRGVLVLLAILFCNIRLFINWKFWAAAAIGLLLTAPSIWWQWEHGWPVIDFHIAIYDGLRLRDMASDLLSMLLRFNPLLLVPLIAIITLDKRSLDVMSRTMRMLFLLFAAAVIWGAFVGMSLGMMAGPIIFSLVYILMRAARQSSATRRYLLLASVFSSIFLFGIRTALLVKDYESPTSSDAVARAVSDTMSARGVELIVTCGDTGNASLLNFYGKVPAWAMPTTRTGYNKYASSDLTEQFAGRKVAIQIDPTQIEPACRDSLLSQFWAVSMPTSKVSYMNIMDRFRPQNRISIEAANLPRKILTGSLMALTLTVRNPYSYEIPMGKSKGKCDLIMQLRSMTTGRIIDVKLPFKVLFLPPTSESIIATTAQIPVIPTDIYTLDFTIREESQPSASHSERSKLQIVNPKSRI